MTARDQFLAEIAAQRRVRRGEPVGARGGQAKGRKCPTCRRPRAWLCVEYGRPCTRAPRKPSESDARLESNRRYWLRKSGTA